MALGRDPAPVFLPSSRGQASCWPAQQRSSGTNQKNGSIGITKQGQRDGCYFSKRWFSRQVEPGNDLLSSLSPLIDLSSWVSSARTKQYLAGPAWPRWRAVPARILREGSWPFSFEGGPTWWTSWPARRSCCWVGRLGMKLLSHHLLKISMERLRSNDFYSTFQVRGYNSYDRSFHGSKDTLQVRKCSRKLPDKKWNLLLDPGWLKHFNQISSNFVQKAYFYQGIAPSFPKRIP